MQNYALDLLVRMVEIYSPSGQEEKLGDLLSDEMRRLGFDVERDAIGNVIGRIGEGKPRILLCGHMDTVPGVIPVRVEDGILYGRGAVDAKGPLAAMVNAASQLVREGYVGEILVVGAIDEEGKGLGVKHLVKEGLDVDYAIFGEPTNVGAVTAGYKGSLILKITCKTETGHSSAPWLFDNAVEKAIEVWNLIKDHKMPQEKPQSRFHSLSSCLRRIEGGETGSVVPSWCEMQIDMRIPPSLTVAMLRDEALRLVDEYRAKNPTVWVEWEVEDYTEPYVSDKSSMLVRAFSSAIRKVRGTPMMLINKTGTGDMNVFGHATGKPTVTYGPGDSHLDHTPQEHISLKDYLDSIVMLKEALKKLYELHHSVQP